MREGIATRIGKADIPVGNGYWERCSLDRGIQQAIGEGDRGMRQCGEDLPLGDGRWEVHPACCLRGPRTEDVGEVHTGTSRHMFHPDHIINGKEDDAMNDAGGDYMVGKEDIGLTLDHIGGLTD